MARPQRPRRSSPHLDQAGRRPTRRGGSAPVSRAAATAVTAPGCGRAPFPAEIPEERPSVASLRAAETGLQAPTVQAGEEGPMRRWSTSCGRSSRPSSGAGHGERTGRGLLPYALDGVRRGVALAVEMAEEGGDLRLHVSPGRGRGVATARTPGSPNRDWNPSRLRRARSANAIRRRALSPTRCGELGEKAERDVRRLVVLGVAARCGGRALPARCPPGKATGSSPRARKAAPMPASSPEAADSDVALDARHLSGEEQPATLAASRTSARGSRARSRTMLRWIMPMRTNPPPRGRGSSGTRASARPT